jgi:PBP1b-binding outer membrane lipoprotein LpoB
MNPHKRLAALLVILVLVGCAQAATGQGPAPTVPYSHDRGPDMRSGNNGM